MWKCPDTWPKAFNLEKGEFDKAEVFFKTFLKIILKTKLLVYVTEQLVLIKPKSIRELCCFEERISW
jgi:hypothetical protein